MCGIVIVAPGSGVKVGDLLDVMWKSDRNRGGWGTGCLIVPTEGNWKTFYSKTPLLSDARRIVRESRRGSLCVWHTRMPSSGPDHKGLYHPLCESGRWGSAAVIHNGTSYKLDGAADVLAAAFGGGPWSDTRVAAFVASRCPEWKPPGTGGTFVIARRKRGAGNIIEVVLCVSSCSGSDLYPHDCGGMWSSLGETHVDQERAKRDHCGVIYAQGTGWIEPEREKNSYSYSYSRSSGPYTSDYTGSTGSLPATGNYATRHRIYDRALADDGENSPVLATRRSVIGGDYKVVNDGPGRTRLVEAAKEGVLEAAQASHNSRLSAALSAAKESESDDSMETAIVDALIDEAIEADEPNQAALLLSEAAYESGKHPMTIAEIAADRKARATARALSLTNGVSHFDDKEFACESGSREEWNREASIAEMDELYRDDPVGGFRGEQEVG